MAGRQWPGGPGEGEKEETCTSLPWANLQVWDKHWGTKLASCQQLQVKEGQEQGGRRLPGSQESLTLGPGSREPAEIAN